MIQETSLMAYEGIKIKLGQRQRQVLSLLEGSKEPLANREIAHALGREINSITPRVKELRDLGLVEKKSLKTIFGRLSIAWGVVERKTQGELF